MGTQQAAAITLRALLVVFLGAMGAQVSRAEPLTLADQNSLVDRHCAVCHTDAARNGGLTLEGFDVEQAAPSLNAMLLSKITARVALETVQNTPADPRAAELVVGRAKNGAMAAAGLPVPDETIVDSLIRTLAANSTGAMAWSVERSSGGKTVTASILREVPSEENANEAEAYRLIASCDAATRNGSLQLTWSPVPQAGVIEASGDGRPARSFRVEGEEKMGNGSNATLHGLASLMLAEVEAGKSNGGFDLPAESLAIRDTLPGGPVTFPLATLSADARQALAACFPGS